MKHFFINNRFLSKKVFVLFFIDKKKEFILISVLSYPSCNKYNILSTKNAVQSFSGSDISDLLAQGDKALNENKYSEALQIYQEANRLNPDENIIYRKLAKTQFHLKDYVSSEKNYETYLKKASDDVDAWIELGETQRQSGFYQKALKSFEKAASLDSSNDLANRSILETKNNILSIYSPQKAQTEKAEQAQKNLRAALDMTVKYMTPEFMQGLKDVVITFGETASMGGTSNIAQYENHKKTITISNAYIYAAPQVIAAYLSHESVHAHDNDPYTSIKEEQDAYQIAAKFWMKNSNGVKDPEMDYAVSLYKQSPSTLNDRVAEIYKLRDPDIADTSPNHPPKKLFHFNTSKTKAASQSIKSYDVIA